jgi:acyl-CoA reductase-like NAD-dependent aldehyde dehydrogenase
VTHPDVAAITFTGSPEVGWNIRARAPRKRVGLELGNNAPVIVHHDADVPVAAAKITLGGFSFSGQTCISVQRVYVHDDVAEQFLEQFGERVSELVVGDPADPATNVSALISTSETDRVAAAVSEAVGGGATVVTGGDRWEPRGGTGVLTPTVLRDVEDDMVVCRTEIFGPVVAVRRYRELDDAVSAANDSRYGLQAGVFTSDISTGLDVAHRLDYGGVCVNEVPTFRADQMPYGGIRDSGNTKEGPAWAVREMTEERMVVIQR